MSAAATRTALAFTAVTTVGGLLPADMLLRIAEARNLPGTKSADYGLPASVPVRDEAERAWEYLKPLWRELRAALPSDPVTGAPSADPTGRAGSDWLAQLFRKLDFGALTEVGAAGIPADSDAEKRFPVSHRHGPALVHLIPWNQELDKRAAAGQVPAQSMLQDCLNRTEAHLWAVLTNGRRLRLLRDSSSFATAAYVEFDLEAIFDGELFSEFVLLYCVLHASRFAVPEGAAPAGCWLERWRTEAVTSGARALDQLRLGVQNALTVLGTGFLRHPENVRLREDVDPKALRDALLRLVYRLLFVFVAEDRDALLDPNAGERQREAYERYFSSARLRERARRRQGTAHGDQYEALRIVLDALGTEGGRPELGLPGLGGLFSHTEADAPLDGLKLSNESLLAAVRHLAQVRDPGARRWRSVDYRHLDAEELGSVYESLLELEPKHSATDRSFELIEVAGNSRKTTGSYYTPSSLIECLLDTTLDPVIDDAVKRGEGRATKAGRPDPADDIVEELLGLTVCDPACGSGHFLVASARRIAKRVASVRERNPEPTVDAVRHALHEVVARCIYGVDLNPMAVELAKVSLWLEALEPGKPLGFLDAHVKHGNGLIGATPKLLAEGVPDDAFKPIEGDDKKYAAGLVKRNRAQRGGQDELLFDTETLPGNDQYAAELARITAAPADSLEQVRAQESAYRTYVQSAAYVQDLHAADAWCAAFVWPKREGAPEAPTDQVFRALRGRDQSAVPDATHAETMSLRDQYRFFHWHLEFPEVFAVPESGAGVQPGTGWVGGFDAVVGNPPWDQVQVDAREFFAAKRADIAQASTMAIRNRMIKKLATEDPDLFAAFREEQRINDGFKHFVHSSAHFPLTAYGRLNTYSLFSELAHKLAGERGAVGQIIPSGIATDSFNQHFFKHLINSRSLVSLYDFRNAGFFGDVAGAQGNRFCLLVSRSTPNTRPLDLAFRLESVAELGDASRHVQVSPEDIQLVNPNTGTCPIFKSSRDAQITIGTYRRLPVLINESLDNGNAWDLDFQLMFMTNTDSHLFKESQELREEGWLREGNRLTANDSHMLPLYEAKMLHQYNHRFGDYALADLSKGKGVRAIPTPPATQLDTPDYFTEPRYWIPEGYVDAKLTEKGWRREWVIGFRKITSSLDERSVIAFLAPRGGVADSANVILPGNIEHTSVLYAQLSSFAFDYVARQKLGGVNLNFFIFAQLPTLLPAHAEIHSDFVNPRVLELAYTAHDMQGFALDMGETGAPYRWNEARRHVLRAELDALFFHLYGISRDDADYILDTFPIVRRKDEAKYGSYRTKELILAEYDRMAAAGLTLENPLVEGESGTYRSTLTPPPGQGPRHD
ncbi:Eco57I restriction-modification methylase domain-containing protein [Streptomyces albogriseolus]|uniref:Eco57I restriction-modification methylase domain-containing protein n=1 Tax=Streptomyces albogriseolus TaxID=1887 RepID=UPI00380B8894